MNFFKYLGRGRGIGVDFLKNNKHSNVLYVNKVLFVTNSALKKDIFHPSQELTPTQNF